MPRCATGRAGRATRSARPSGAPSASPGIPPSDARGPPHCSSTRSAVRSLAHARRAARRRRPHHPRPECRWHRSPPASGAGRRSRAHRPVAGGARGRRIARPRPDPSPIVARRARALRSFCRGSGPRLPGRDRSPPRGYPPVSTAPAPILQDPDRLAALRQLALLDAPEEAAFAGSVGLCSDGPPVRKRRRQLSQLQAGFGVPQRPLKPDDPRIARQLDTTTTHHGITQQNPRNM